MIRLLARREHSRWELQRKLQEKWPDNAQIQMVLDALSKEGLQSDARFTESYVRMRAARGFGPVRIRGELNERGVNAALIEECLELGEVNWEERAHAVRRKRFHQTIPKDFADRAREMRFLQYRGFTHEQITSVFAEEFLEKSEL